MGLASSHAWRCILNGWQQRLGETHRHCGTLLLGGGSHHAIPLSLALALDDFVLQPQSMAHGLWYGTKSRNANARCILAQALGA